MMTEWCTLTPRKPFWTKKCSKGSSQTKRSKSRFKRTQVTIHKIALIIWTILSVIRTTAWMTSWTLKGSILISTVLSWLTWISKTKDLNLMMKILGSKLNNSRFSFKSRRRITLKTASKRQWSPLLTFRSRSCTRMCLLRMSFWQSQMLLCHMSWGIHSSQLMLKTWRCSFAWRRCVIWSRRTKSICKVTWVFKWKRSYQWWSQVTKSRIAHQI